jgi:hypothetical protein
MKMAEEDTTRSAIFCVNQIKISVVTARDLIALCLNFIHNGVHTIQGGLLWKKTVCRRSSAIQQQKLL